MIDGRDEENIILGRLMLLNLIRYDKASLNPQLNRLQRKLVDPMTVTYAMKSPITNIFIHTF